MSDKCDIRQRVIILLLASTGMRVGALPVLRIGDIKKFEEHDLYLIWVYNNSRKDRYYTFCSVECAHAVDDYLAYRKRLGEEIKDSNPLIRNKVTADNPFVVKASKFIKVRSIQLIVKKLQKEAGIVLKDKKDIANCHGFRNAYISILDRTGVQYSTREYLSGHRLLGQDSSYLRPSEEDRLVEYRKALDFLTISSESKLRQQIKNKESEIKFIHEDISSLKRCINHMISMMQKQGYDTEEIENQYDEYTDNVTKQ
jgi:site-specific recombinase XerD